MSNESFCERHGPYDASLGKCPFCGKDKGLPPEPPPLDHEQATTPWDGREIHYGGVADDEEETDPRGSAQNYEALDEEVTDWPKRRAESWEDDEEVTDWPRRDRGRSGRWEDDETVVERAETGLLGFLIVKEGMRRGQVHRIRHGTTIGRGDAKLLIRDAKISRSHAKFTVEDEQFFIWDFGSENGTFVNGDRIREATALQENDVIKLGDTAFVLKTLE